MKELEAMVTLGKSAAGRLINEYWYFIRENDDPPNCILVSPSVYQDLLDFGVGLSAMGLSIVFTTKVDDMMYLSFESMADGDGDFHP